MSYDLLGIFGAGLLTFASPCILPLAPIYLATLSGASIGELEGRERKFRTVVAATAFTLGLALVFVLLGMAATTLGRALVLHRAIFLQLGGLAVFLFGLKTLGVLHLPWLDRDVRPGLARTRGGSALGAFTMGAAFALGWTPCIGPVLGSVLTFTATATTRPLEGAAYLAVYASGLGLPLVAASFFAPFALGLFQRMKRWLQPMQLATGAVLAIVGLLLLTDNVGALAAPRASSAEADRAPCATDRAEATACSLPEDPAAPAATAATPVARGPTMIEFVGRTCPVCRRMAPIVAAMERACVDHRVRIERVEVDAPEGRALARRHGVLGVPTFLFLEDDGREVARLVGEQSSTALWQPLQALAGERCDAFLDAVAGGV